MGSSDSAEAGHAGSGTTALLLTTLSGLSTGLGALVILAAGAPSARKLGHLLAFSAGVMVYLSFADLLFSSIEQLGFLTANIAVCCWPFFHLHHKPFFFMSLFCTDNNDDNSSLEDALVFCSLWLLCLNQTCPTLSVAAATTATRRARGARKVVMGKQQQRRSDAHC